jgi:hypothetical protein
MIETLCYKPEGHRFKSQIVDFFFNLPNPSSSIMDPGLTQPLTAMSTRNLHDVNTTLFWASLHEFSHCSIQTSVMFPTVRYLCTLTPEDLVLVLSYSSDHYFNTVFTLIQDRAWSETSVSEWDKKMKIKSFFSCIHSFGGVVYVCVCVCVWDNVCLSKIQNTKLITQ